MLLHLPEGYKPEQVRDVLAAEIKTLPESLRLSLTWDQGPEMRDWKHVSIDAGSRSNSSATCCCDDRQNPTFRFRDLSAASAMALRFPWPTTMSFRIAIGH